MGCFIRCKKDFSSDRGAFFCSGEKFELLGERGGWYAIADDNCIYIITQYERRYYFDRA